MGAGEQLGHYWGWMGPSALLPSRMLPWLAATFLPYHTAAHLLSLLHKLRVVEEPRCLAVRLRTMV